MKPKKGAESSSGLVSFCFCMSDTEQPKSRRRVQLEAVSSAQPLVRQRPLRCKVSPSSKMSLFLSEDLLRLVCFVLAQCIVTRVFFLLGSGKRSAANAPNLSCLDELKSTKS